MSRHLLNISFLNCFKYLVHSPVLPHRMLDMIPILLHRKVDENARVSDLILVFQNISFKRKVLI